MAARGDAESAIEEQDGEKGSRQGTEQETGPLKRLAIGSHVMRGGEQQALYLMQGLRARGHHVELVCREGQPFAARAAELPSAKRTEWPWVWPSESGLTQR